MSGYKERFSLTKIINISSCLMMVLLALDLHSLAARINHAPGAPLPDKEKPQQNHSEKKSNNSSSNISSDPIIATKQTEHLVQPGGWTPTRGIESTLPQAHQNSDEQANDDEGAPSLNLAEEGLKKDISDHEKAMEGQAAQIATQRKELEAEQKKLDDDLQSLARNNSELSSQQEKRKADIEAGIERMARVYEQMPPRDAAGMFNVLDMRVMVPIAQHMMPRKVSDIMGNMDPDRANILSQYLAGIRQLSADTISRLQSPKDYPYQ